MDIQKEFGKRVRELRLRRGLTQDELAVRCGPGFVMQRIGELERGEANCTLRTVEAVRHGLECDPLELFMFHPDCVGDAMHALDSRLVDLWRAADETMKRKAIKVLTELIY